MTFEFTSALRILYGEDVSISPALLEALHPDNLKTVFRQRALELHPDRAFTLGKDPYEMSEAFKDVKIAYEVLLDLLGHPFHKAFYTQRSAPPERGWSKTENHGDTYWEAALPEVSLLFGQFLYYAGLITPDCLLSAITWQRRQRPSFGRIARTWEYLSEDDLLAVMDSKKDGEKVGEAALRLGYLNRFQRNSVLGFQKYLQRPIGEFFREIGLLREEEIDYLVRLMRKHNKVVRKPASGSRF